MITGTAQIASSAAADGSVDHPIDAAVRPLSGLDPAALQEALPPGTSVVTDPALVERLSKDFYWYSPVLKRQLEDLHADVVVQPENAEQIEAVLRFAYAHAIPVTARGAGTGNYGQAVPLRGGIVLDLAKMNRILEIEPAGVARCEPGARLGAIETAARKVGWELRCYPSTYVKATVGGFLAGGSGGIGSVRNGVLRDPGMVVAVDILTMEAEPRRLTLEGANVLEVLHAYGTNGIMVECRLALAPKTSWAQLAAAFPTWEACYDFSEAIAYDDAYIKRLVTPFEWPIPSFFTPVKRLIPDGCAMVFMEIEDSQLDAVRAAAETAGGQVTFAQPYAEPRQPPQLSDYTWNHTTLWAIKKDPAWTYLQAGFDRDHARDQFREIKAHFPTEFYFHIEFLRSGGGPVGPGSIPVVRFTNEERLQEIIDTCRGFGVLISNPHVYTVEDGGRCVGDPIQTAAKHRYDPHGLFNPGKLRDFDAGAEV
jgi:FAD/FMN-containing dehydrogenase